LSSWWQRFWTGTIVLFGGKKIALLGQQATGKTRLLEYILESKLPDVNDYHATITNKRFNSSRDKLGNGHRVRIKAGTDVGGTAAHRDAHWQKLCIDADVIGYLVRADVLLNSNAPAHMAHRNRINIDTDLLAGWLKILWGKKFFYSSESEKSEQRLKKVFLYIATHADLVPQYEEQLASGSMAIHDQLYESFAEESLKKMVPFVETTRFVLGTTANREGAEMLKTAIAGLGGFEK
jgi:hypothetical protein